MIANSSDRLASPARRWAGWLLAGWALFCTAVYLLTMTAEHLGKLWPGASAPQVAITQGADGEAVQR